MTPERPERPGGEETPPEGRRAEGRRTDVREYGIAVRRRAAGVARQLAASSREDPHVRPIAVTLLAVVLAFAFLLRLDAAVGGYGTVPGLPMGEGGQRALQSLAAALRPQEVEWEPVEDPYRGSDPAAYLNKARAMERFYAADIREPLYVASVKAGLWAFDGRDVAVSYVSLAYSVLLVWATYMLGAFALCRWVGLAAATLFAAELEVVGWSVQGWRDDAFSFFFILSLYALLRLAATPSLATATGAGVATGLATLTRITSLSFVVPGLAIAAFPRLCGSLTLPARSAEQRHADGKERLGVRLAPAGERAAASGTGTSESAGVRFAPAGEKAVAWRARLRAVAVAALVMVLLLGPFLLNCWLEYGDPLYSINFATRFYRERAGQDSAESMDVGDYLASQARDAPMAFTDLALNGFTTYPFNNKWRGLAPWSPVLAGAAWRLSLLGLALFLWSANGRYLLLTGLASLAPYAFTWRIVGGAEWRFTMHVYPLYLLAAVWAVDRVARFALRLSRADLHRDPFEQRALLRRALVTLLAALALAVALHELPHRRLLEDLRAGRAAHVRTGENDTRYFARGWHPPVAGPNVTARYDRPGGALMRLPMIGARPHRLTLRLQPYHVPSAPPQRVALVLNGEPLGELALDWDPARVGSYELRVPAAMVRAGLNDLELRAAHHYRASAESGNPFAIDGQEVGFFIWYVNVTPLEGTPG